ncbi:MAG: sigma 54-interacting transcriptional regulator [Xanthomonadaceae bacterium]|nr:sigma 54-interacting transcriptional regulator [Xanthomonadaceae bacterium]
MKMEPGDDDEVTLSVSVDEDASETEPGLCATVLWHSDIERIGDQAFLSPAVGSLAISRRAPMFGAWPGASLGCRTLSRSPTWLRLLPQGGLEIEPAASRMPCYLDGRELREPMRLPAVRVASGVLLRLGGSVLLCLHRFDPRTQPAGDADMLGRGAAMACIRRAVLQAAATDLPVLVLGETGTGKELVAQAIHRHSRRAKAPLIAINMATLAESLAAVDLFGASKGAYTGAASARSGLFAEASGGTLFLDEIGDTPSVVQPMLLRVLETGEFRPVGASRNQLADVRVIAATDRDLSGGGFNQPLRRRLEALSIILPPLRDRREDIGLLLRHFLNEAGTGQQMQGKLSGSLVESLCLHAWPGNIRELRNAAQRLALMLQSDDAVPGSGLFAALNLDRTVAAEPVVSGPVEHAESAESAAVKRYRAPSSVSGDEVLAVLEGSGWRVRQAAQALGVSRASLYALIEAHDTIRKASDIPRAELEAAMAAAPGRPEAWAAALRTPREALRRWVKSLGL